MRQISRSEITSPFDVRCTCGVCLTHPDQHLVTATTLLQRVRAQPQFRAAHAAHTALGLSVLRPDLAWLPWHRGHGGKVE